MSDRRRGGIRFLTPKHPQVPPLGHYPDDRIKIPSVYFVSLICENIHNVWYKNSLKFDFVIEIKWYLTF